MVRILLILSGKIALLKENDTWDSKGKIRICPFDGGSRVSFHSSRVVPCARHVTDARLASTTKMRKGVISEVVAGGHELVVI